MQIHRKSRGLEHQDPKSEMSKNMHRKIWFLPRAWFFQNYPIGLKMFNVTLLIFAASSAKTPARVNSCYFQRNLSVTAHVEFCKGGFFL